MDEQPQSRLSLATVVLFAAFAGLFIAQIFTIRSLRSTESRLAAVEADQSKVREMIDGEVAKLHEAAAQAAATSDAERQKALDEVRDEVEKARRQARGVAGKVKEETMKSVEDLASRVDVSESKLKQHQDAEARVATEITSLKQATTSAQSNITDVSTEVKQVRTEVANTQGQLERTIADLKRTTGDMGVLSGLIATNSKEIDALKQLGDRDYTEFTLYKTQGADQAGRHFDPAEESRRQSQPLHPGTPGGRPQDREERPVRERAVAILRGERPPAARAGGEPGGEGPDRRVSGHAEDAGLAPLTAPVTGSRACYTNVFYGHQ